MFFIRSLTSFKISLVMNTSTMAIFKILVSLFLRILENNPLLTLNIIKIIYIKLIYALNKKLIVFYTIDNKNSYSLLFIIFFLTAKQWLFVECRENLLFYSLKLKISILLSLL